MVKTTSKMIKPITIEIDEDTWNSFKEITPRTITLNDAVVQIIEDKIKMEKQE